MPRSEFARRFSASSDLFQHGSRRPSASINYVAAHDGRPLADVVSYAQRHNDANGEGNRDGHAHEVCSNLGIEGRSDDPSLCDLRRRLRRAMMATVLLAQGTPMLCAGDEVANSQQGNNNAYCQDNATGWLDWSGLDGDDDDIALIAQLVALRASEAYLRWPEWFAPEPADDEPAIRWLRPEGEDLAVDDWHDTGTRAFACQLQAAGAAMPRGVIIFNPERVDLPFHLPEGPWELLFDSSGHFHPGASLVVPHSSLVVLRRRPSASEPS